MRNTFRFPVNKAWAVFLATAYLYSTTFSNGLHLHADWHHAHNDGERHYVHVVLHGHSDFAFQIPTCADDALQENEHQHPLGESRGAAFFQVLNKRSRLSESKKAGDDPFFVFASFPKVFFSELRTVPFSLGDSPPQEICLSVSSGRSPPLT